MREVEREEDKVQCGRKGQWEKRSVLWEEVSGGDYIEGSMLNGAERGLLRKCSIV